MVSFSGTENKQPQRVSAIRDLLLEMKRTCAKLCMFIKSSVIIKKWQKISTFMPSKTWCSRAANSLTKTKRKLGTLTSLEGLDCYTWKMCMPVSLTFLFRALSFSTTPSSRDTTESTTGKLLSVFSSSATTIVTWLVSLSMFFWAALKRLFRVSYGTCTHHKCSISDIHSRGLTHLSVIL